MATLDALYRITARPVGFQQVENAIRGVQRVGQDASKALGGIGNILGSVTGGVAALGVGLSAAGVAAFAKNAIDAADNMRDLSQRTGASVEMLSKFQQMADMSGSSIEAVGGAMVKLSRGMTEAAETGKGPAAEALRYLGISAVDAAGQLKGADQVMLEVADRFQQMQDGSKKASLAVDLFGRSGAELIPMLNEGRQAIEGLNATMSTEFANKADAYNDSLAAMGAVFGQIGMEIAGQLLPYLSSAVDWLTRVGVGFRDWIVANREPIRQTIETVGKVGQALTPWVVGITALVTAYNLLSTAVKAATVAKAALLAMSGPKGWALLAGAAVAAGAAVWGLNQATQAAGSSANAATLEAQKLAAKFRMGASAAEAIVDPVKEAKQEQEAFKAAVEQSNARYEVLKATIEATSQQSALMANLQQETYSADVAVNNAAKSILEAKLSQAKTDAQKIPILKQIMGIELENARIQHQAVADQIAQEVELTDLKRQKAWQELRSAQAALATAEAYGQQTEKLREQVALMKIAANSADIEYKTQQKVAAQKQRANDAQYNAQKQVIGLNRQAPSLAPSVAQAGKGPGMWVTNEFGRTWQPAPAFAGGGYTGDAPRSGGLDGKGGFMAMLHPRETVIDHARSNARTSRASITIQTGPIMQQPDGSQWVSIGDLQAAMEHTAAAVMGQLRSPAGRMALRGA